MCSQLVILGHRVRGVESGEIWVVLWNTRCSPILLTLPQLSAPENHIVGTSPQLMWRVFRDAYPFSLIPSLMVCVPGIVRKGRWMPVTTRSWPVYLEQQDNHICRFWRLIMGCSLSHIFLKFLLILVTGLAVYWWEILGGTGREVCLCCIAGVLFLPRIIGSGFLFAFFFFCF